MELFDKRFVHFMWDDELKGKQCFVADNIGVLKAYVESCESRSGRVVESGDNGYPFLYDDADECCGSMYQFAYYDPNYEAKRAFNEGKKIQVYDTIADDWVDLDEPLWCMSDKYRIKPEEKWIAYLARASFMGKDCHLTACKEDAWEMAQEEFAAKTKLFVGAEDEVVEWYKPRRKFAETIKAWEDGKMIQIRHTPNSDWVDLDNESPKWHTCYEYRVKPECPCEDGIDSKACAGCPQDEARKDQSEMEKETYYVTKYSDGFRVTPFKALGARFSGTKLECKGYVKYQEMKNEGAFTQKKITYRPFKDCNRRLRNDGNDKDGQFRDAEKRLVKD